MAKIISFVTTKGGAGKTVFNVSLAIYYTLQGKSVCILDCDPKPASFRWSQKQIFPNITAKQIKTSFEVAPAIKSAQVDFDVVLVDTSGALTDMTKAVVSLSDTVVIPSKTSEDDIIEALGMYNAVCGADTKAKPIIVINGVTSQAALGRQIKEHLVSKAAVVADYLVPHRSSFPDITLMNSAKAVQSKLTPIKPLIGELQMKGLLP